MRATLSVTGYSEEPGMEKAWLGECQPISRNGMELIGSNISRILEVLERKQKRTTFNSPAWAVHGDHEIGGAATITHWIIYSGQ